MTVKPKLVVTEQCQGLYNETPGSEVQDCEHAVSHLGPCGPDPVTYPLVTGGDRVRTANREVQSPTVRMMSFVATHPALEMTAVSVLLAMATHWQFEADGGPVLTSRIAKLLNLTEGTVNRYLGLCPFASNDGDGWYSHTAHKDYWS